MTVGGRWGDGTGTGRNGMGRGRERERMRRAKDRNFYCICTQVLKANHTIIL
jgi:hypothetical protein